MCFAALFYEKWTAENTRRPNSLSSSAAAAPLAVDAAVQVGHLPLGGGEELLELVLKGLVPGRRQRLLRRPGKGPGLCAAGALLRRGMRGGRTAAGPLGPGRGPLLRLGLLDGKVDLPVLRGQDQHLDGLPLLQKVMHVVDKGIGDLRDMYQAAPAALQCHKRAEFGDGGHLTLQNAPNLRLHTVLCFSFH